MQEEFDALQRTRSWSLVSLPPGKNVIGCKWVFKVKKNSDGTIQKYKARLVAKGYNQVIGFDFTKTFSPVVKPGLFYLLLSLVVEFLGRLILTMLS